MTESMCPSTPEIEPTDPFLAFLLQQLETENADPTTVELFFDLDETMFSKYREMEELPDQHDRLTGNWRPGMSETLSQLSRSGYGINLLSGASKVYIHAALDIYQQQFDEDPWSVFKVVSSTDDYRLHEDVFYGTKGEIWPVVARATAEQGKRASFIDDAFLDFEAREEDFNYVRVPHDMCYWAGDESTTYKAAYNP